MPDIVTLTMNPAIDLSSEAEQVRPTHKIRTDHEGYHPGGGGVNVARAVHELGGDVEAICLAGGATGDLLQELLQAANIRARIIPIAGNTRINHVIHELSTGLEYRFVHPGPPILVSEVEACLAAIAGLDCNWFIASGSLPPGVPDNTFARIADIIAAKGAHFVLDSSGIGLSATLAGGKVTLVKPSLTELEGLVGRTLDDPSAQDAVITDLIRSRQAKIVALTLGADGAALATQDGVWRLEAPKVEARSTVGAGDSFLAGLTLALSRGLAPPDALAYAVAAGAGAVLCVGPKLCRREDVERLDRELRGRVTKD